jgi:hypothetical protein
VTGIFIEGHRPRPNHTCQWRKVRREYLPEAHSYRYTHACTHRVGCPGTRIALVSIPEPKLTVEVPGVPGIGLDGYTERWMCEPPPPGRNWTSRICDRSGWSVYEITASNWGTDPQTGHQTQIIYAWRELYLSW